MSDFIIGVIPWPMPPMKLLPLKYFVLKCSYISKLTWYIFSWLTRYLPCPSSAITCWCSVVCNSGRGEAHVAFPIDKVWRDRNWLGVCGNSQKTREKGGSRIWPGHKGNKVMEKWLRKWFGWTPFTQSECKECIVLLYTMFNYSWGTIHY